MVGGFILLGIRLFHRKKIARYSAAIAGRSKCRDAIANFCTTGAFGAIASLNANSAIAPLFSRYCYQAKNSMRSPLLHCLYGCLVFSVYCLCV